MACRSGIVCWGNTFFTLALGIPFSPTLGWVYWRSLDGPLHNCHSAVTLRSTTPAGKNAAHACRLRLQRFGLPIQKYTSDAFFWGLDWNNVIIIFISVLSMSGLFFVLGLFFKRLEGHSGPPHRVLGTHLCLCLFLAREGPGSLLQSTELSAEGGLHLPAFRPSLLLLGLFVFSPSPLFFVLSFFVPGEAGNVQSY